MTVEIDEATTLENVAIPTQAAGHRPSEPDGLAFVGPFAIVFLAFLVRAAAVRLLPEPLPEPLIGGTRFVLFGNYVKAFTDAYVPRRRALRPQCSRWC